MVLVWVSFLFTSLSRRSCGGLCCALRLTRVRDAGQYPARYAHWRLPLPQHFRRGQASLKQLVSITNKTVTGGPPSGEAALIASVLLGDRKAVAEFVLQYSDTIYSFLHRRIDDRSVVEDLCQEVFLVAWSKLATFRAQSSLKTWLCAIAKNKAADYYRRHIRELPIDDELGEQALSTTDLSLIDIEQHFDRRLQEEKIRATMLALPKGYRSVLRWRYWDEHSLQEIAAETGRTAKSIERLLARARAEFAAKWKEGPHANES